MRYADIVLSQLSRNRLRTWLLVLTISVAFVLFGLLNAVRTAFTATSEHAYGAHRLVISSRTSLVEPLPLSLLEQIGALDDISAITHAAWFGGFYRDAATPLAAYAVAENYLDLYPEIEVDPWARRDFAAGGNAILVGDQLAKRFGWKVGSRIPVRSTLFPAPGDAASWEFNVAGLVRSRDGEGAHYYGNLLLLRWDYLDDAAPYLEGRTGWYVARVDDLQRTDAAARAIDALSLNSDHETRTMSEQAAFLARVRLMADVELIVFSVMGAVLFTLLLTIANGIWQATRERRRELAILKAMGFSPSSVFFLVLAEPVLLFVVGALVGLAVAFLLAQLASAFSGGLVSLRMGTSSWLHGIALAVGCGLLVGLPNAACAARLRITAALGGT